jgi:hypothetical protein
MVVDLSCARDALIRIWFRRRMSRRQCRDCVSDPRCHARMMACDISSDSNSHSMAMAESSWIVVAWRVFMFGSTHRTRGCSGNRVHTARYARHRPGPDVRLHVGRFAPRHPCRRASAWASRACDGSTDCGCSSAGLSTGLESGFSFRSSPFLESSEFPFLRLVSEEPFSFESRNGTAHLLADSVVVFPLDGG